MLDKIKLVQAIKSGRFANITNIGNIYEVIINARHIVSGKDIFNELSKKACKIDALEKMKILRDLGLIADDYLTDNMPNGQVTFNWSNDVVVQYLLWTIRYSGLEGFIHKWSQIVDHSSLIEFINEQELNVLDDMPLNLNDGCASLLGRTPTDPVNKFVQLYVRFHSEKS